MVLSNSRVLAGMVCLVILVMISHDATFMYQLLQLSMTPSKSVIHILHDVANIQYLTSTALHLHYKTPRMGELHIACDTRVTRRGPTILKVSRLCTPTAKVSSVSQLYILSLVQVHGVPFGARSRENPERECPQQQQNSGRCAALGHHHKF